MKHLYISTLAAILFASMILPGCSQMTSTPLPTSTLDAPALRKLTETPAAPTPTVLKTQVQPTPLSATATLDQNTAARIDLQNAAGLEITDRILIPGATDFKWCLGGEALCVALPQEIRAYSLSEERFIQKYPASNPSHLEVSPSGNRFAWVEGENTILIADFKQNTVLSTTVPGEPVIDLVFDPGEATVVVSNGNPDIQALGVDGSLDSLSIGYPGWLVDLTYSPEGNRLAGVSQEEFATLIFDAATGSEIQRLEWLEHASPVLYGARFSPNWQTLAWITRGTIQLMDVASSVPGPMLGHEDFIVATDWSPDSTLIAAAAAGTVGNEYKPVVYLWDPEAGQSIAKLVHDAPILQIAFAPDGSRLASLDADGTLYLWATTNR